MDSSPVLRQQSQNKIQRDFHRRKNEQNVKPVNPKLSKLPSSPRLPHKNSENKNPGGSKVDKKAPVRPGGSRLPVLAKPLQLQAPSNFSQVRSGWEGKPLVGKARTKKPCTRPVPFNFSQPRSSRVATEKQQDSLKPATDNTRKTKPLESKGVGKPTAKTADVTSRLLGQSGPSSSCKTSDPKNTVHHKGASASAVSAEVCVNDLKQLTLNDASKSSQTAQHGPPREKGENFQFDHKALLSVLCNEGGGISGPTPATPLSKPFNAPPKTASIMKSHHKAGSTTGSLKSVQFSPDAAALQSILLNEGVKAGGSEGVTPRNSVCPPGRGTSIYTAQRVPVKKMNAESTDGPTAVAVRETPLNKWNPERVRNSRHQPMSALKWQLLGQPSPYNTPGIRSCKSKLQLQQEAIVQRLFDDLEGEQSDKIPDTRAEPVQASEEREESSRTSSGEEQRVKVGPPFIQAPQRDSVIFFSTGTKLFRAPVEKQESCPAPQDQPGPVSVDQRKLQTQGASEESTCQINPSDHLHRESAAQKSCTLSDPVAVLRRRFLPLEEARLDEEVATFTSLPVLAGSRFLPPRPRCGNPLASILHVEESTRFVPIGFPLSTGSFSPLHD